MSQRNKKDIDEIRELILSYFYSKYKRSRSVQGVRATRSEVKRALKKQGLKENEIASNLFYLIQTGWIIEDKERFTIPRGKTRILVETVYYKISEDGINHFEGPSKFQRIRRFSGINITNIQGAIAIGEGNIVQNQYSDLYRRLDLLGSEIRLSDKFSDAEKLNYQAEIETIKSQLAKPAPDKSILQKAWDKLKPLATIHGIASFLERVRALIEPLL